MFKLVAHCLRKEHERVGAMIRQVLPTDPSAFEKDCEPYVFCNSYFAMADSYRHGTSGQSWGTGAAGWFWVAMFNYVFGLRPTLAGLVVDPCLPPAWPTSVVGRRFRGADYTVTFDTAGGHERIAAITVNGAPLRGEILPWSAGARFDVRVTMGSAGH